jgi:hypothetical protein
MELFSMILMMYIAYILLTIIVLLVYRREIIINEYTRVKEYEKLLSLLGESILERVIRILNIIEQKIIFTRDKMNAIIWLSIIDILLSLIVMVIH